MLHVNQGEVVEFDPVPPVDAGGVVGEPAGGVAGVVSGVMVDGAVVLLPVVGCVVCGAVSGVAVVEGVELPESVVPVPVVLPLPVVPVPLVPVSEPPVVVDVDELDPIVDPDLSQYRMEPMTATARTSSKTTTTDVAIERERGRSA
jgi:hypothetical protein